MDRKLQEQLMFLADCPNCRKQILIPGNHMKAVAQCPLCEYEFSVEGIASTEVQEAVILRSDFTNLDGDEPAPEEGKLDFDFASDSKEGSSENNHEGLADALRATEPQPDFEFRKADAGSELAETSVITKSVVSPFVGNDVVTSERTVTTSVSASRMSPKNRKSPAWEVVKIIAGGFAGITIAQVILWWLPGDWRRDPLHIAPQLPTWIAFAAPDSLRNPDSQTHPRTHNSPIVTSDGMETTPQLDVPDDVPNNVDLGNAGINRLQTDPPVEDSNNDNDPQSLTTSVGDDPNLERDPNDVQTAIDQPQSTTLSADPKSSADPNPLPPQDIPPEDVASVTSNPSTGNTEPITDVKPDETIVSEETTQNGHPAHPEGLIGAPSTTVAELAAAIATSVTLTSALGDGKSAPKGARREFYIRLAELARTITYLDSPLATDSEQQLSINRHVASISADPFKLALIGASVSGWLDYSGRKTDGVVVAGSLREIRPAGSLFAMKIELAGKPDRFMNVVTSSDPQTDESPINVGDAIMIMGIISEKPAEQIAGYNGDASMVIWQGMRTPISTAVSQ